VIAGDAPWYTSFGCDSLYRMPCTRLIGRHFATRAERMADAGCQTPLFHYGHISACCLLGRISRCYQSANRFHSPIIASPSGTEWTPTIPLQLSNTTPGVQRPGPLVDKAHFPQKMLLEQTRSWSIHWQIASKYHCPPSEVWAEVWMKGRSLLPASVAHIQQGNGRP